MYLVCKCVYIDIVLDMNTDPLFKYPCSLGPFLQTDNLRKMIPEFISTGTTLCEKWAGLADSGPAVFDLWHQIPQAALDTAFKTAFSFETKCQVSFLPSFVCFSFYISCMNLCYYIGYTHI